MSVRSAEAIRIKPSFEGDVGLRANGSKVPAATRKELLRDQFISEVAEHLLLHKGPDSDGRAHPTVKRIQVDILENAIEQAKSRGLGGEWRPYHFTGHVGTYNQSKYVDEVLTKALSTLLVRKFEGDLHQLFTGTTWPDLTSPFNETIAGRIMTVSTGSICTKYGNSPYRMLCRFRDCLGLTQFADFQPYHLPKATRGTFADASVVDRLLVKQLDSLLERRFGGDLLRMFTELTKKDFAGDLEDSLGGTPVKVSMGVVSHEFGDSPYPILCRYRDLKGLKQFDNFKPYHAARATRGTYADNSYLDGLLVAQLDRLLIERFGGDVLRLFTEVSERDIFKPLHDSLGGKCINVSLSTLERVFGSSPYQVLCRYRDLKGVAGLEGFRPYHCNRASTHTFADVAVVEEVLVRGLDSLLAKQFSGDLFRLFTESKAEELLASFDDALGDRRVEVSMVQVGAHYGNSPFAMLCRYRDIKGLSEFSDFKPYHRDRVPRGTLDSSALRDELLIRGLDNLVEEKFGRDYFRLFTEANATDLFGSFADRLAGRAVSVSMGSLSQSFDGSPYQMLSRYRELKGLKIPSASKACFMGSPETRARRLRGEYDAYDRKLMRTIDGDFDTNKFGMRVYDSIDKGAVRELMLEVGIGVLGETPVKYLGLEDQHLESIRLVRSYLNLSPKESVIVERDSRVFRAMNSLRKYLPNGEGRDLSKVNIIRGTAEDEIPHLEGRFNLVNLDFVGHLSQSTVDCLRGLLSGRLEDKAVIAVTLMDTPLARERTERASLGANGARELPRIINEVSKELGLYTVELVGEVPYFGGTGAKKTPMITQLFHGKRQISHGNANSHQGEGR